MGEQQMASRWDESRLSDQSGKTMVITGGNSGIGFEAAKMLAGKGARVVLAVRSMERGQEAARAIRASNPEAEVDVMHLDLSRLDSVRNFADAYLAKYDSLSVLVNNAGVMAPPHRKTTDGFELQFGTNHLGHFALTGRLLPRLLQTEGSRVVVVSSAAHKAGKIHFENLDGSKRYRRWAFYSQSKLANLLFMRELQRRLAAAGAKTIAVACHPGFASTKLVSNGMGNLLGVLSKPFGQSAYMGALPTVYAATESGLQGGAYVGPTGRGGMRGYPGLSPSTTLSKDMDLAKRLWALSEQLTGVQYETMI